MEAHRLALDQQVGSGDTAHQLTLQQHPAAALQRAQHTARLAFVRIAAEAESLQVAEVACAALVPGHDVVHVQGALVLVCLAALAAASGAGEHPDCDGAAHQGVGALLAAGDAVAGEHLAHHAFHALG